MPASVAGGTGAGLTSAGQTLQDGLEIAGNAMVELSLSVTAPVATVSAKLTDVAADGTSTLVTRGTLNLTRRGGMDTAEPLVPGEVYDVVVEVSDGSFTDSQAIAVTVTPANDNAPAVTSGASINVAENTSPAPVMSFFIVAWVPSAGLRLMPPESYLMPLPTKATFRCARSIMYLRIISLLHPRKPPLEICGGNWSAHA